MSLQTAGRPILFIFDDAIAAATNVRKAYHTPRKDPRNPVLRPEQLWEGHRIQPWGSLFQWEGRWRQLYNSLNASGEGSIHVLESEDGRNWTRPALGLRTARAGTPTNALIAAEAGQSWLLPSLIHHPNPPDPSLRYLLYLWGWGKEQGFYAYKSQDGLHFEKLRAERILAWGYFGAGHSNDVAMAYWDEQQGRFVLYATALLPQTRQARPFWDNAPHVRRCLQRFESRDGLSWTEPELILTPDRHEPEWQQYYGMTVSAYEGLWIGFPLYYHVVEQFMQPHIAFSRDGRTWERQTRQPFLPCGDSPERWDYGNVLLSWDFLRRQDELLFIYGGTQQREHTNRMSMALGLAALRRDGFVSLAPGGAEALEAEITTVPFAEAAGCRLLLNTEPDCSGDGWLSVEVRTASGHVVAGYEHSACGPVAADSVACEIRWGSQLRLPVAAGPLQLHVRLHRQRLYAIRFADKEAER